MIPLLASLLIAFSLQPSASFADPNPFASKFHQKPEKFYQEKWCQGEGRKAEVRLKTGERVDCLTETHAIEFDFARKYKQALGQALTYATLTGKEPGIVLIVESEKDLKYLERLHAVLRYHGLKILVQTIRGF